VAGFIMRAICNCEGWRASISQGTVMLFAYIDAAVGSMLLQAVAGMFFAVILMGRRVLLAPCEWLRLNRPAEDSEPVDAPVSK
jgi:hypothetical protein